MLRSFALFIFCQGEAVKQGWRLTRRFNAVFVKKGRGKPCLVRIPNAYALKKEKGFTVIAVSPFNVLLFYESKKFKPSSVMRRSVFGYSKIAVLFLFSSR